MDFKSSYNRRQYIDFFKNQFLPEDFVVHDENISLSFSPQFIKNVIKIGELPSCQLNLYEIEHLSENDPRVSISRESFRFLARYGVKRALILFTSKNSSNFRLSLVTIDLKWEQGNRVQKEYSNPRRYSFFLGSEAKTHTPEEYLVKKGRVKDFEDLKNRFSIEVVNKEFYNGIALLFTKLAGGKRKFGRKILEEKGSLQLPSTSDDILRKEFTVRLIGRLVFCWFLKKKRSENGVPLLPEDLLSLHAVQKNSDYYHHILEPLFFEVLNKLTDQRPIEYQTGPWQQIPFLNGGLFNPDDHDFYATGRKNYALKVPDEWIRDLFEVFETYNFTIDENTAVDIELAIEPEMLGRIFENLLAEINPETGETARKSTGSYYTPRPIVDYMVDESLKQYLLIKVKLDEKKIISLLSYEVEETELNEQEKNLVINALDTIKIIDPACGSGAFPMGILQKIVLILHKIDPDSDRWLEKILSKIENSLERRMLKSKLEQENVSYNHKLGIIRDSIYGVDIQSIAVEISKLRFFLSLVVEEKVADDEENRGIMSLPNLEFKFVCANSLIGLPPRQDEGQLFSREDESSIKKLRELRDEYFTAGGERKKQIESEFKNIQGKMFVFYLENANKKQRDLQGKAIKSSGKKENAAAQTLLLSRWDPFSGKPCDWFASDWMFGITDGFDIVIANPPYVRVDDLIGDMREKYKKIFKAAAGKYDLYYLFFEKSFSISKKEGTCVFISPNKFCAADSADTLRNILFDFIMCGEIVSTSKLKVFQDAANYPVISVLKGSGETQRFYFREAYGIDNLNISDKQYSLDTKQIRNLPQSIIPINIGQNTLNLV